MQRLNITFCSFPDYSGNAKALYQYMVKKYGNIFNYVWIVSDESVLINMKSKNINSYLMGSKEFNNYISKTDVFFTTHANLTGNITKKSIYIELWHAVSPKNIGFMCNNITPEDENWYDDISEKIDYFIVPTNFWIPIFSARFHVKPDRILPLGLPLLNNFNKKKKILGNLLQINLKNYKKIIYYLPTFKKGCGRDDSSDINNLLNLHKYDEKKLIKYLEDNNYLMLIKSHPSEETEYVSTLSDNIKVISDKLLVNSKMTINDILHEADLILTDYSSIGLFSMYLNIPTISLIGDYDNYRSKRGIIFNNINFWNDSVENVGDLFNSIQDTFKGKHKEIIVKRKQMFFGDLKNDGGCSNICNYFFSENGALKPHVHKYFSRYNCAKEEIICNEARIAELNNKIENLNNEIKN